MIGQAYHTLLICLVVSAVW